MNMFEHIDGVIAISGDLYVKTPEALEVLLAELRTTGYQIDNLRESDLRKRLHADVDVEMMEKNGWSLWYAHLDVRRGKCGSCNGLISVAGICCHGHQCELCGAVTYYKVIDGSMVRFSFVQRDGDEHGMADITMKAQRWDTEAGYLYLYPEIHDGLWLRDKQTKRYFEANRDKWEEVTEDGQRLIRVRYPEPWDYEVSAINPSEIHPHSWNHKIVLVWEGKEYDEYSRDFPLPKSISIYETWHWAPLERSPRLHERIIHAIGMVSDCGYYYQDGQPAFYDLHLENMRRFVEHFTELDLEEWDRVIPRTDRSGPGMIRAIAQLFGASFSIPAQ